MKKFLFVFVTVLFFVAALAFFIVMPVVNAISFPGEVRLTNEEYHGQVLPTHRFISGQSNYSAAVGDTDQKYIDLKLFGLFTIKRVKVDVIAVEELAAGGLPIGFVAKSQGVIVIENAPEHGLKKGDIIKSVNGTEIASVEDFNQFVKGKQALNITFQRGSNTLQTKINADMDERLGLWLKDETTGVGILTYVNPENNNFAALGHRLADYETGANIDIRGGDVYCTNVIGLEKSSGRRVGEFKSTLRQGSGKKQGTVLSSNSGGVFGCLFAESELLQQSSIIYPVGSRYSVRPGKAKLRTSLDGINVHEYDIEILKTFYQAKRDVKSMIIRVTDRELLSKSGGIIHGMSGSPIIQNGKIIGALTHVVVNDTTKGYGIYIDFIVP